MTQLNVLKCSWAKCLPPGHTGDEDSSLALLKPQHLTLVLQGYGFLALLNSRRGSQLCFCQGRLFKQEGDVLFGMLLAVGQRDRWNRCRRRAAFFSGVQDPQEVRGLTALLVRLPRGGGWFLLADAPANCRVALDILFYPPCKFAPRNHNPNMYFFFLFIRMETF